MVFTEPEDGELGLNLDIELHLAIWRDGCPWCPNWSEPLAHPPPDLLRFTPDFLDVFGVEHCTISVLKVPEGHVLAGLVLALVPRRLAQL